MKSREELEALGYTLHDGFRARPYWEAFVAHVSTLKNGWRREDIYYLDIDVDHATDFKQLEAELLRIANEHYSQRRQREL